MARPTTNTTKKTIAITYGLLENAQTVAGYLGITFPEYVRNLIVNDTRDFFEKIPVLDKSTIQSLGKALKEAEKQKGKELRNKKDIESFVKSN